MRVVIPAIELSAVSHTDEINNLKQVATAVKSYFYNGNTVPVTIFTNSQRTIDFVEKARKDEKWPLFVEEADIDSIDQNKYTYGHIDSITRPLPTIAKLYTMHNACADEDAVMLMDADTLITSAIPFNDIKKSGITVFQPEEWFDSRSMTNGECMFINSMQVDRDVWDIDHSYASLGLGDTVPDEVKNRPWLNSGFTIVTKEFREKHMDHVLEACSGEELLPNEQGLDERILFYLQLSAGKDPSADLLTIDTEHRLNVPTMFYKNIATDYLSFNDSTLGFHFQLGAKPCTVQMNYEGHIITDRPLSVYGMSYPSTAHTLCSIYGEYQFPLMLLWQYYYSLVSYNVVAPGEEYVHPAETFKKMLDAYSKDITVMNVQRNWWK